MVLRHSWVTEMYGKILKLEPSTFGMFHFLARGKIGASKPYILTLIVYRFIKGSFPLSLFSSGFVG